MGVLGLGLVGACAAPHTQSRVESRGAGEACPAALVAARAQLFQAGRAVVRTAVADLLERPEDGVGSPPVALADQALFGELVTVLPSAAACTLPSGRRVLVKTAAPYRGYADVASLLPWPEPTAPYRTGVLRRIESRFANVYPQPDLTRSNPLLVLPLGVPVRQERVVSPRWVELLLPDGRHGFVQQGDLEATATPTADAPAPPPSPSGVASCVLSHALAYEGSPYLWGGRSTYGIDCSGLVASSYGACGVTVPRDARQQFAWDGLRLGPAPAPDSVGELRPGDLLFFTSPEAPPAGTGARRPITHVGVYVGDGRFVHASTSERPSVHQSQLRDEEWQRRWVGTRRYVEPGQ